MGASCEVAWLGSLDLTGIDTSETDTTVWTFSVLEMLCWFEFVEDVGVGRVETVVDVIERMEAGVGAWEVVTESVGTYEVVRDAVGGQEVVTGAIVQRQAVSDAVEAYEVVTYGVKE